MSLISDAINRISVLAQQRGLLSILKLHLVLEEIDLEEFYSFSRQEQQNLIQAFGMPLDYLPLTVEQIYDITKVYPFQLPNEVLDLYQYANGCFPIGSTSFVEDWEFLDRYCYLDAIGGIDLNFCTLSNAVNLYKYINNEIKISDLDPRFFPIFTFESGVYGVLGGKVNRETSILIKFDVEDGCIEVSPSLTNLILAYAEILETGRRSENLKQVALKYQIKDNNLL